MGNIVSITDNEGNDISNDSTHIANINLFRYRSYYYNPVWGRFINADSVVGIDGDIISYNAYAYCSNNPINYIDLSGKGFFKSLWNGFKNVTKKAAKAIGNVNSLIPLTIYAVFAGAAALPAVGLVA